MVSLSDIKKGLYRYEEPVGGWVVKLKDAASLLQAAEKARDAGVKNFDTFTPYPIHGLEKAMGLSRSWLPVFSLMGGLFGGTFAFSAMTYIDQIEWKLIHGGKPYFPWPAYIPITFELTILFTAFFTLATVFYLGRLGKPSRRPVVNTVTSDGFAVWIGDSMDKADVEKIFSGLSVSIEEYQGK